MERTEYKPLLLATRRRAMFAVCFAVYCAAVELWDLFFPRAPEKPSWFVPFNSAVPGWVATVLNLLISASLIWALVEVCRFCKRAERVFFAACFAEVLLVPLKTVVPMPVVTAILWVQALGTLVMIVSAIFVYRDIPARAKVPAASKSPEALS